MQTEQQIISAAADVNPSEAGIEKLRTFLSQDMGGRQLVDLAIRESLGGFLYRTLLKTDLLARLKPQDQQRLYTNYYLTIRRNLKLLHLLNMLLEDFNRQNIQVVLLQGISLLHQVYADVGLRPMNDMDLWVLPRDYPPLVESITRCGFQRDRLYPNTFTKGEAVLDIHTHILWAERIKSRQCLINTGQEEIFRQSVWITMQGRNARCLSDADQVLYLGLHALKHNFDRLIWLVDIKHLTRDWDALKWEMLVGRAKILGVEHIVSYVTYLLKNIFEIKIPARSQPHLARRRLSFFERKILKRRINGTLLPVWSQMILISTGKSIKARLLFILESLFPRVEVLRQVFARSRGLSVPQLYWKRVLQIFGLTKAG